MIGNIATLCVAGGVARNAFPPVFAPSFLVFVFFVSNVCGAVRAVSVRTIS